MQARPNINGNTPEDFRAAFERLDAARKAMADARSFMAMNVVHGRNYQHLDPDEGRAALEEDSRTPARLQKIGLEISEIQSELLKAIPY
jgi:hypothetical protein